MQTVIHAGTGHRLAPSVIATVQHEVRDPETGKAITPASITFNADLTDEEKAELRKGPQADYPEAG